MGFATRFFAGVALLGGVACGQVNHGRAQVVDEDGEPVASAKVQFWCGDADSPRKTGFTDSDGRYAFGYEADYHSVQSGNLVASKDGYEQSAVRYVATKSGAEVRMVLARSRSTP